MTIDQILDEIIQREGSAYTDLPADKGGPTKYGITLEELQDYLGHATIEDLQELAEDQAKTIYRTKYVGPFVKYANGDTAFLSLLADSAVQHGVGRVLNHWIGNGCRSYATILARRIQFYGEIVVHDPSQLKFLDGWLNRVTSFIR